MPAPPLPQKNEWAGQPCEVPGYAHTARGYGLGIILAAREGRFRDAKHLIVSAELAGKLDVIEKACQGET